MLDRIKAFAGRHKLALSVLAFVIFTGPSALQTWWGFFFSEPLFQWLQRQLPNGSIASLNPFQYLWVFQLVAGIALLIVIFDTYREKREARFHLTPPGRNSEVTHTNATLDKFQETLIEWMEVNYKVASEFIHWRLILMGKPNWPGEHTDIVHRENKLYTSLRLCLDNSNPKQARLAQMIDEFRENNTKELGGWIDRRNELLQHVRPAFATDS